MAVGAMEARRIDGLGLDLVRPARRTCSSMAPAIPACGIRICARATTSGRRRSSRATPTPARRAGPTRSTAHDSWDYDEIMENVLVDMDYGGRPRKLIVHPGRTGFVYVLDRETGELLSAETFQPTNWASGYDLKTGKALEDPAKQTHFGTVTQGICPSSTGAKDVIPSAFSPRTGLLYIPAHNTCMDYEGIEANYIAGTPYLGADVKMYPGPGGYQGELVAWDVAHNRKAWGVKDDKFPVYSGVLATGGDVVFYGTMDGWFKAVDAQNGNRAVEVPRRVGDRRRTRSPISARTASSTSRSTRASADGWARSRSRRSPPTIPTRARRGRRDEGHQEVHGAQEARSMSSVCRRSSARRR